MWRQIRLAAPEVRLPKKFTFAAMFKSSLVIFILTLISGLAFSQATVTGVIVDETTGAPLSNAEVRTIFPDNTLTDSEGHFSICHRSDQLVSLFIEINGQPLQWDSKIVANGTIDLGIINVAANTNQISDLDLPTLTIDEGDEDNGSNISGLLQSSDDLFGFMTDYTFSPGRFRRRGLESYYAEVYMNQLQVNDLETGYINYNSWGGLNDVLRNDDNIIGAEFADWGFGGIAGTSNTDLRATTQWRQKKISYAVANRNYRNRIMGTWSTGLLPGGWAVTLSGSRRWAQEGYYPGTFYNAFSYFASVGKKINESHTLNLIVLGSPLKRGGNSISTQEMYDLAGDHYYNSFWGYQQGEKRSSRIYSAHQPYFMLDHDWTLNDKLSISTSIGYQVGRSSAEALDWLYGNDPRPDYYRRLPSYVSDPLVAEQMRERLMSDESLLQVQWDKLYEINLNSEFTVEDVDGIAGNIFTGALSKYVMEERRSDLDKKMGNIVLLYNINETGQLSVGATVTLQDTRNYKVLSDLLGGEFYLDWDKFAETDFPGNSAAQQNDLLRPNRIVSVGDQFGYDYHSRIRQYSAWFAYQLDLNKWELAIGAAVKNHTFWREGNVQNGKFQDNSLGNSEKNNFFLPSGKALIRYKFDGRNYFTVSGMYAELAPTFKNAFVSPRTRNDLVKGLEAEQAVLGEARYDYKSPYLKFSVSGFYATTKNGIESTSFYHETERTFINFSLIDIDKKFTGIEGAVEYSLIPSVKVGVAASLGQYIYTSRPKASITQDNDGSVLQENITIYAKNFYVGEAPQTAYTFSLTYESKNFWKAYVNVNRFQDHFISFNPIRRTEQAIASVEFPSAQWDEIILQEEIDGAWTVDVSLYKSWKAKWINDDALIALNVGVTNLLNNTDYINAGYEQFRFDTETRRVGAFPSKYGYMPGINYFIQGSLRF